MPKPQPHVPRQAHRTETYRGVEISVDAYQQPRGTWTWSYIAGDYIGRMRGAQLPDADAALKRGMLAARARVDMGT